MSSSSRWSSVLLTRAFLISLLIASGSRIAVFIYAYYFPITNEVGMSVSPTTVQPWIDFKFYLASLELYRSSSVAELVDIFIAFYERPLEQQIGNILNKPLLSGPVFPFLIYLFDYREGNTLPLALLYLLMSVLLVGMWMRWAANKELKVRWLVILALVPNPFWFMLNITTDLIFSLLVAIFYFIYTRDVWKRFDIFIIVVVVFVAILTRPNGITLLLFVFLDFLFLRSHNARVARYMTLVALLIGGVVSAAYLYPYLMTELLKTLDFKFFGIPEREYITGLFPSLPRFLDLVLSWGALLGTKVLYFVGLRPSHSGIATEWLLLRAAAGLVLLPGLIYVTLKGDRRDRLFIWSFSLPVFVIATQDRYNLPIQPLLLYYGLLAYQGLGRGVSFLGVKPRK